MDVVDSSIHGRSSCWFRSQQDLLQKLLTAVVDERAGGAPVAKRSVGTETEAAEAVYSGEAVAGISVSIAQHLGQRPRFCL